MEVFRGPVQVRTGVAAFAELSLTTRPQDQFVIGFIILMKIQERVAKIRFF